MPWLSPAAASVGVGSRIVEIGGVVDSRNVLGPVVGLSRICVGRHDIPSSHHGTTDHQSPREN